MEPRSENIEAARSATPTRGEQARKPQDADRAGRRDADPVDRVAQEDPIVGFVEACQTRHVGNAYHAARPDPPAAESGVNNPG